MGQIREHSPVLLLVAAFSRYSTALDWARERVESAWGPIALESERFSFDFTTFYEQEMGVGLQKCFWAFQETVSPECLPRTKHITNELEVEFARTHALPETRPLNLDPGYLTEAKLVLATTKDRDHRLYLSEGIYAEGTLFFHKGAWRTRPWTYPDYQSDAYHRFFLECRQYLRESARK